MIAGQPLSGSHFITMLRVASFGDAFAELKLPPSATVSPSSTLDLLPEQAAPSPSKTTQRRVVDQAPHHALRIVDGRCLSSGDSALEEEGECFIAHLGLGEEWGMPVERPTAMSLPEGSAPIMEVAAGDMHSLLLDRSGAVWSCGGGWEGPLGHGDPASSAVPRPILALAAVRIDRIAAGGVHSLALSETGQVWSWGWGIYGQLGHGDTRSLSAPRRIEAAPPAVVQISAGHAHTLLVCRTGRVYTCGRAEAGQLGHGGEGPQLTPLAVESLAATQVVEAHAQADCCHALGRGGERYAWGAGFERVPNQQI